LPCSPRSPVPRVWLPSRRCEPPQSVKASFSFPHSWASPFRAFFRPGDRKEGFPTFLPLWLFPAKPSRLGTGASAASSHRKSGAPSCFPGILPRGGALCSPGPCDLSGFPVQPTRGEASLSSHAPLALSSRRLCSRPEPEPQGFGARQTRHFPPKRAPACLAFLTDDRTLPFWTFASCGLFFHLGDRSFSRRAS
jgi:hypothetical protein